MMASQATLQEKTQRSVQADLVIIGDEQII